MRKRIFITLLAAFATLQTGCDSGESIDSEKPEIEILSPQDGAAFEPGGAIDFHAKFSDNIALGSYRIEIHLNSDGHSHGRLAEAGQPFEYENTGSFDGKREAEIELSIPIGHDAAHGEYHLGVHCTDEAGNESVRYAGFVIEDAHDDN